MTMDAERRRRLAIRRLTDVKDGRLDSTAREARDEAVRLLAVAEGCMREYERAMTDAEEWASELRGYLI